MSRFQFIVALDPTGRAMMTRDMELIRKIFAEIRARQDDEMRQVVIPGTEDWIVTRHLEMLIVAGFVEGTQSIPISPGKGRVLVRDLTMSGHDFAACLENMGVWQTLKDKFSAEELTALPLKIVQTLASELLMKWALSKAAL